MIRRIVLVGAALAVSGCYDVPRPACGFFCGTGGACPDDYTCNQADNRCHLNGAATALCPTRDGGPLDAPADAGPDANPAPFLTHTTPTASATGVGVTVAITADFSEEVLGVASPSFRLVANGTVVEGLVTYTTGTHAMAFVPDAQLSAHTVYNAIFSAGITDLFGAPLLPYTWTFTTGDDTVDPIVRIELPAPSSTNVAADAVVSAQFDETVTGVDETTFRLTNALGGPDLTGTVTYAAASRTATFTPDAPLADNLQLRVLLGPGIADTSGNPLAPTPTSWTFSTPDTAGPQILALQPDLDATNVAVTSGLAVTFDEEALNVSAATFTLAAGATPIAGTVNYTSGTHRATFVPDAPLPAMTTLTATLTSGITDASGNPLAPFSWMFTTR